MHIGPFKKATWASYGSKLHGANNKLFHFSKIIASSLLATLVLKIKEIYNTQNQKRILILLLLNIVFLISPSNKLYAQYGDVLRTGRPGQAIGAYTVGNNILQYQHGFEYNSYTNSSYSPYGFNTTQIIRFGILEALEISTLIEYQYQEQKFETETTYQSGIKNLQLGFRFHINDQKGWVPATAFQMRLKMPSISKDYESKYLAPIMIFVTNWGLPKKMNIATNWVLSYNGNDAIPTGKYVVHFGFPIYNKLKGFTENYGQLKGSVFETRFDGGFAYLINNNFQLDLYGGYGSNNGVQDYFVNTGISWRIVNFR
jgi:hypothetical protein